MTGYGRGESDHFKVEIRSSNHKGLDININAPHYLFSYDPEIRKRVKQRFSRGRIDIHVLKSEIEGIRLKINKSLAREYYNALVSLKNELSIPDDIGIDVLASQREIFSVEEPEIDIDKFYAALDSALEELKNTRVEEGKNLIEDIKKRIELLNVYITNIENRRTTFIANAQQRLLERLKELLEDVSIDESRLIQETAFLIEKSDITEEIVRIKSHLKHSQDILKSGDTIGKKIDFFVQELRREVNTIGSKSQDVEIVTNVVEMKHELEKIREQAQNLQ
jgi:uncharacterized protein (TIGR00255 family)